MLQAFKADVLLAENLYPCSALLAHKLELPWVNYWAPAPLEPDLTSLWSGANRRLFQPNPLSYLPQSWMRTTTQRMVRICAHGVVSCLCHIAGILLAPGAVSLPGHADSLTAIYDQAMMLFKRRSTAWPAGTGEGGHAVAVCQSN